MYHHTTRIRAQVPKLIAEVRPSKRQLGKKLMLSAEMSRVLSPLTRLLIVVNMEDGVWRRRSTITNSAAGGAKLNISEGKSLLEIPVEEAILSNHGISGCSDSGPQLLNYMLVQLPIIITLQLLHYDIPVEMALRLDPSQLGI